MGKVVLITGASSGIGSSLAKQFASRGFDLLLLARREDRLKTVAGECQQLNAEIKCLTAGCDVTKPEDIEAALVQARKTLGEIHVVIANAGFGVKGTVEALKVQDYRRQFEVNVFGVLNTIAAVLPEVKRNQGIIAITGSVMSYVALPQYSAYCMSKFAIRALAESLYHEMKPYGVHVTFVGPGFVKSEITQVDNNGVFRPEWKGRELGMFMMDTDKAAKEICQAILKRKQEIIVTKHGKAAVFLRNHLPSITKKMLGLGDLKWRKAISKT